MVEIHIRGGGKKQRRIVHEAIEWAAYDLHHKRMADNLEIEAEILNLGDMAGYCIWSDSNIAPRSFELELNVKQSDEDLIVTVMHEMVHVWQYATGRVRERFRPMHRQIWKNSSRWYGDTKYSELPWEREAYKLQEELYDKYTIGSS